MITTCFDPGVFAAAGAENTHDYLKGSTTAVLALGALGAFVVLLASAIIFLMRYRRRAYRLQNASDGDRGQGKLPRIMEAVYDGLKEEHWHHLHSESNRKQGQYWVCVFGYSVAILLAFTFLIPSVAFHPCHKYFLVFVAWFELYCFLAMPIFYFRSRIVNRGWIWMRARTELLRQATFLALTSMMSKAEAEECSHSRENAVFNRLKDEIERAFGAKLKEGENKKLPDEKELDDVIEDYRNGASYREAVEGAARNRENDELLVPAGRFYYSRRLARQESWFRVSERRMGRSQERRELVYLILFVVGICLVVAKVCLSSELISYAPLGSEMLSALLLVITAMAACMAASSLNSNSRSLGHRYRMQCRLVARLKDRLELLDSEQIEEEEAGRILSLLPEFEDMMIDELEEWVEVTARDRLELGP